APPAFRLAGRFCVRKRGRVAYCSELTPRRTFGRPNPSQGPVSSNLTASTIKPVGPSRLHPQRPLIINPGIAPQRKRPTGIYALHGGFSRTVAGHPPSRIAPVMNTLSRDQQIQIIACLTEGQSIRATERITGIHRDTIMRLGERIGRGCEELHDRMMAGLRVGRIELDEIWGYVGKKQKRVERHEIDHKGDQYTYVALGSSSRAIITYRTGKRDSETTDNFVQDLRQRVVGVPEIS